MTFQEPGRGPCLAQGHSFQPLVPSLSLTSSFLLLLVWPLFFQLQENEALKNKA